MKTFELVLLGHPDKTCDIIAESIKSISGPKKAVEVVWFDNTIIIGGEVSNIPTHEEIADKTLEVLKKLDYTEEIYIYSSLQKQSEEIIKAVQFGAGDNGIFIAGYDKKWTPIQKQLKDLSFTISGIAKDYDYRTDGKFIATFYEDGTLAYFTINIAKHETQNEENKKHFVKYLNHLLKQQFKISDLFDGALVNPRGEWMKCGGFADSGLTGRKLACDNSLGLFRQGGGAFFGKDITKADYSVPIYLSNLARVYAKKHNYDNVELHAHTIIGDEKVKIFTDNGVFVEETSFTTIKNYAKENPLNYLGL